MNTNRLYRLADLAATATLVVGLVITFSQLTGSTPLRTVAVLQALTPYVVGAAAAATVWMAWRRNPLRSLTGVAICIVFAVLTLPLITAEAEGPAPDVQPLRVAHLNMLYDNDRVGELAEVLKGLDVDVITLSEYTPSHADQLEAAGLGELFPHHSSFEYVQTAGVGSWSRQPVDARKGPHTGNRSMWITVIKDGQEYRILVAHPPPPTHDVRRWHNGLDTIAEAVATPGPPTIVTADLNAAWWHPPFRDLLDTGLTDAHISAGSPWSRSWPNGIPLIPPFVQIDHILVDDRLTVTQVSNFDGPGSDHRGVIASIAPVR